MPMPFMRSKPLEEQKTREIVARLIFHSIIAAIIGGVWTYFLVVSEQSVVDWLFRGTGITFIAALLGYVWTTSLRELRRRASE